MSATAFELSILATLETQDKLNGSVLRALETLTATVQAELAEIRDGLVDLDHAKAPKARLDELHTRVDGLTERQTSSYGDLSRRWAIESTRIDAHHEELGALRDDLAVLRNDYRGEPT